MCVTERTIPFIETWKNVIASIREEMGAMSLLRFPHLRSCFIVDSNRLLVPYLKLLALVFTIHYELAGSVVGPRRPFLVESPFGGLCAHLRRFPCKNWQSYIKTRLYISIWMLHKMRITATLSCSQQSILICADRSDRLQVNKCSMLCSTTDLSD